MVIWGLHLLLLLSTKKLYVTVFAPGNPVYIYNTEIGDGVTSINNGDDLKSLVSELHVLITFIL